MTLRLRRKLRTTVRSITPGTRAAKAAALLALLTAPVLAQPPGTQPGAPPRPIPGFAQPNGPTQPANPTGGPAGAGQPATPSNGLALPPGYRPRTPPPQPQQSSQPVRAPGSSSGDTMMYFQKPADALTATGGGLPAADGVAAAPDRVPAAPLPVPDVAPARVLPPPVPVPSGFAVPTGFAQPDAQPPLTKAPPGDVTSTSEKKQELKIKPVDPKDIQLPPREKIFGVSYNDAQLERAVMDAVIQDRIRVLERQLKEQLATNKDTQLTQRQIQELRAIKDPLALDEYQFPTLPVVSPPGAVYQPKTLTYAPSKMLLEPGYVVHRRLFSEQRNLERAGWDLGPLATVVSAGKFYRDVLLWPATLASGCTYGFWDTSAGKCLPGSPTPFYLYPPNLTVTGGLAEAGIITGFSFLFP